MTLVVRPNTTREQWLEAAVFALRPIFDEVGATIPVVRVSCGWPSRGGTGTGNRVIGQCWGTILSSDKVAQLFISPVLHAGTEEEGVKMLGVLAHELVHAVDDCQSGHKGAFARVAKAIGLTGKMTSTTVGPDLAEQLKVILADLGEYPHAPLNPNAAAIKRQTTRMLKLQAVDCCDYIVRTTAKWLDGEGYPMCPHGSEMVDA